MRYNNCEIDVVWLDLDDTLIDFKTNSGIALRQLYAQFGLSRLFDTEDVWAEAYLKHNHALWALYNVAKVTSGELRRQRFMLPLTEAGMSAEEAEEVWQTLDKSYLDLLAVQHTLVPGALELLKKLRTMDVVIAVISNGFKEVQYRKIKSAGLEEYIDLVVLSDDIDVNKPDVRLFKYAMERSGVPDARKHLIIGDNAATDIAGALNASWHAIHFNPMQTAELQNEGAYVSAKTLDAISGLLRE